MENNMTEIKFKLTSESITNSWGVKLFRIEAIVDIEAHGVSKGDKGGFVESTHLKNGDARVSGNAWVYGDAQVFGNAWVSGDARVYGDARVSGNVHLNAKMGFKLGWFIGGDDTGKIKDITSETGTTYWKNQYVLGDYEIESLEEDVKAEIATINIGGTDYKVTEELTKAPKGLKEAE